jgi:hypothetical protein
MPGIATHELAANYFNEWGCLLWRMQNIFQKGYYGGGVLGGSVKVAE